MSYLRRISKDLSRQRISAPRLTLSPLDCNAYLCQEFMVASNLLHRQLRLGINHPAIYGHQRKTPAKLRALSSAASEENNSSSSPEDLITVRLVSINDVYDLTKLPRLATFVRSLGKKNKPSTHINGNFDASIKPSAVTLNGDFLSPSSLSSIDGGRGHVAAIRAAGITHVSLGNHEADLPLNVVKDRLNELAQRGRVTVLNSNVSGLGRHSREMDIVSSGCGRIKVGLLGLLSDEPDVFRDGTFRGLQISDVKVRYQLMEKVDMMRSAHCLVPLTHQSLNADAELAKWMLDVETEDGEKKAASGVILGGHEHVKIHEHVKSDNQMNGSSVQIVKSGMDSERAAIIDLRFNPSTCKLEKTDVYFEELTSEQHQPCPIVNAIVNKHLSALEDLQDFTVFDKKTMLSEYFVDPETGKELPLSSKLTRYEQSTFGAFCCTAVKSELGVDVCVINGAPIKANKVYPDGTMSYEDLRNELPFPLKMIVVEMTQRQLRDAIDYSRTNVEKGKTNLVMEDGRIERRGYLQTDFEYWRQSSDEESRLDDDQVLTVALPRNLLKGFCKIQPLLELQKELELKNALPIEDNYIKAINHIVRYCCKNRWTSIAHRFTFSDLDLNNDGALCRGELRQAMKRILGEEPSDDLVESMMSAIDDDSDGVINEAEFDKVLSAVRSQ